MYVIVHYRLSGFVLAIDSVTNKHLDDVAKTMFPKWQETKDYSYDMYYVLSDAEKMPTMRFVSCLSMYI